MILHVLDLEVMIWFRRSVLGFWFRGLVILKMDPGGFSYCILIGILCVYAYLFYVSIWMCSLFVSFWVFFLLISAVFAGACHRKSFMLSLKLRSDFRVMWFDWPDSGFFFVDLLGLNLVLVLSVLVLMDLCFSWCLSWCFSSEIMFQFVDSMFWFPYDLLEWPDLGVCSSHSLITGYSVHFDPMVNFGVLLSFAQLLRGWISWMWLGLGMPLVVGSHGSIPVVEVKLCGASFRQFRRWMLVPAVLGCWVVHRAQHLGQCVVCLQLPNY